MQNINLSIIIFILAITGLMLESKLNIIIQRLEVANCWNLQEHTEAFDHCINSIKE